MKKLLVILFSVGLALGASAQRGGHFGGGGVVYHPRVVVSAGVGYGFGYGFGYGYGPYFPYYGLYGPWGYPYSPYYNGQRALPPQLAYQIEDIKSDYKSQIKATRHDKTLPRPERRARIHKLKQDRDQAVTQARKDYYYNSRKNYNNNNPQRNGGGNGSPNNGNPNNANPNNNNNQ